MFYHSHPNVSLLIDALLEVKERSYAHEETEKEEAIRTICNIDKYDIPSILTSFDAEK